MEAQSLICALIFVSMAVVLGHNSHGEMQVIRANNVTISSNPRLPSQQNARQLVNKLVQVANEHIQFVKAETDQDLIACEMHPFVEAVHLAFSEHLPLVISPDMIWYLISSGVAQHINANAEAVRNKFVDHEGKKTIKVRRDEFVLGSQTNPWHEVIDEFCAKIGDLTKNDVASLMQGEFSTTSDESRVVSQIVLMDSMQKYFDYKFYTLCGIPEFRVSGSRDDWVNVSEKTQKLVEILPELSKWFRDAGLAEILENFIKIFDGHVDKKFWDSIYKVSGGSGGPFISGWMIALFPYLDEGRQNPYIWGDNVSWKNISGDAFEGLTTASFDYHMNQVPFTWVYYDQEIKMLFVGGMLGVSIDQDKALSPIFGYAVTENQIKNNNPDL